MAKFELWNKRSGAILGVYEGDTEADALDAMARDAGYASFDDSLDLHTAGQEDHAEADRERKRAEIQCRELSVTDAQIAALRTEAAEAGDDDQVKLCDAALAGDDEARGACDRAIRDAQAMAS